MLKFQDIGVAEKQQLSHESVQTGDEILPLDEHIKIHIKYALERTKGKISGSGGAAELLKINPGTLRAKMRKLDISHGRKYKIPHQIT